MFVVYFSKDLMALDTIDFWVGTFCIYVLATIQVILFGWVLGVERGMEELRRGAEIRIPPFVGYIIKYVSPVYLLVDLRALALPADRPGPRKAASFRCSRSSRPRGRACSVGFIAVVLVLFLLIINQSVKRWKAAEKRASRRSRHDHRRLDRS